MIRDDLSMNPRSHRNDDGQHGTGYRDNCQPRKDHRHRGQRGLRPLVVLYLTKLLIDAVTQGLKTPSVEASLTPIAMILAGLAGVAVATAMLTVVASVI